jgi:arylsulfate sulfotransferase
MWRIEAPVRKRTKSEHVSLRRTRFFRPDCTSLEDRQLLSVTLTASGPTVPLVGSPVTWNAWVSGDGPAPVFQFRVGPAGGTTQVLRDFSDSSAFTWNPLQQGTYEIEVIVKASVSATTGESATATYTADSRVTGTSAVVSPTSNPLVALFSAPPSPGSSMYVQFKPQNSSGGWSATSKLSIVPGESTNFLVGGMLPSTTYLMRYVLNEGTTSTPLSFTTGALPKNVKFPTFKVLKAPTAKADPTANIVFHMGVNPPRGTVDTLATNLKGQIVWYYDPVANDFPSFATSVVPGGTVLLLGGVEDEFGDANTLREVDLAGDTLRETNVNAVNAELSTLGQPSIVDFTHDAERLPNGDTVVLALTSKVVDFKGKPTNYVGDMVLVLDQNFQVTWVWDAFNYLNIHRLPVLGNGPGDWLHANSVAYSPADGNLIVSLRNQSWVLKIDYANGTGDGHIIWRLGPGGNFKLKAKGPSPWFTYQHDVSYINNNTIVLFDDGNVRHSVNSNAESRGQELVLNEQTMVATLVVNADLGSYASALGSAQALPNGNLDFDSGFVEQTVEVLPNGKKTYVLEMHMRAAQYRSFMYADLYGDT